MPQPLPPATIALLADLRLTAKYLDRLADTALTDDAHTVARIHAIRLWTAIDRVEELARLVEDFAVVASSSIKGES